MSELDTILLEGEENQEPVEQPEGSDAETTPVDAEQPVDAPEGADAEEAYDANNPSLEYQRSQNTKAYGKRDKANDRARGYKAKLDEYGDHTPDQVRTMAEQNQRWESTHAQKDAQLRQMSDHFYKQEGALRQGFDEQKRSLESELNTLKSEVNAFRVAYGTEGISDQMRQNPAQPPENVLTRDQMTQEVTQIQNNFRQELAQRDQRAANEEQGRRVFQEIGSNPAFAGIPKEHQGLAMEAIISRLTPGNRNPTENASQFAARTTREVARIYNAGSNTPANETANNQARQLATQNGKAETTSAAIGTPGGPPKAKDMTEDEAWEALAANFSGS